MGISPPKTSANNVAAHVRKFIDLYQQLDSTNLERLSEVYHPEILFTDPLHHIQGLSALESYFAGMYDGVLDIQFDIQSHITENHQTGIEWCMHYRHRKLKRGQIIHVNGMSWLYFDQELKIIRHRDYFDAGQMLYEQLPFLGRVISYLKRRVAP